MCNETLSSIGFVAIIIFIVIAFVLLMKFAIALQNLFEEVKHNNDKMILYNTHQIELRSELYKELLEIKAKLKEKK